MKRDEAKQRIADFNYRTGYADGARSSGEITDEMVEAACRAHFTFAFGHVPEGHPTDKDRELILTGLVAAMEARA